MKELVFQVNVLLAPKRRYILVEVERLLRLLFSHDDHGFCCHKEKYVHDIPHQAIHATGLTDPSLIISLVTFMPVDSPCSDTIQHFTQ